MDWNLAKEKLPIKDEYERYSHVIGVVDGETRLDIVYDHEDKKFQSNWDTTANKSLDVTHWMLIPEPPNIK